ncbi:MAG TPA: pyruvate, phosphate dikinase, partial [Myxococcota bacterium]|nr:pyruvate, phosphate dikinase [Myxococcota bacterium]
MTPKLARTAPRRVYSFRPGQADGDRDLRDLLGGKGANLAEMCRLGLPVPPGFTISTEVCGEFAARGGRVPAGLAKEVQSALGQVESVVGRRFGDRENPLLVSVRSGARVSMPGMMDTVLNLGLNDATVEGLARKSGNPRFAWDAYRRFVQMYADVVLGLKAERETGADPFEDVLESTKRSRRARSDAELDVSDLRGVVAAFKRIAGDHSGEPFPNDPMEQLWGAIGAVFRSWGNERAIAYRAMNRIPDTWGTAVNVVAMVFGNLGSTSGTGVAFTRDPATGEKRFYGEVLMNAQGEDVVAGIRTPLPVATLARESPAAWRELNRVQKLLERHFRDMQDVEFTIEDGRLWMLQCRSGKRTGPAAVQIAVDMVRERLIGRDEAIRRVAPESLDQLLQPVFAPAELAAARADGRLLTKGLNAGPGAASGRIAFGAKAAREAAARGESALLVRVETSPEDILGMQASAGILTARGGMTSHAALVARQMGRVCVVGAGELEIDAVARTLHVNGRSFAAGEWLSLDGTSGEVYSGRLATQPSPIVAHLAAPAGTPPASPIVTAFLDLMRWADQKRRLRVRANADQPDQCRTALAFGSEGIGLCRTEHMFFGEGRIDLVRAMILAESPGEREKALAKLLPLQRADFEGIFRAMSGHPV